MIPWSVEGEQRLRRQIRQYRNYLWANVFLLVLCAALWWNVPKGRIGLFAAGWALAWAAIFSFWKLEQVRGELGWEACAWNGRQHWPGSGMLANKPRGDLSRLTSWIEHHGIERGEPFLCRCGIAYCFTERHWIANVPEEQHTTHFSTESAEALEPVDEGGGRYVLHCVCGVGHFMVKQ